MLNFGSSTIPQLLKIAIPLIVIFWTLSYFGLSRSQYGDVVRKFKSEKSVFVADFLDNEIDGKFNGAGIQKLCTGKKWTPGLIFSCAPPAGGIAIVRNAQLHCIRFAIEAGGTFLYVFFYTPRLIMYCRNIWC
jgi:hypothetical protein